MKISPVNYSISHQNPSFRKFKDAKTDNAVYDYFQENANQYLREPFYNALKDCDYITFSTDTKTGKVIGTPRTDEVFRQSKMGKISEFSINFALENGYFDDVTGIDSNKYVGNSIARDILDDEYELRLKQKNSQE